MNLDQIVKEICTSGVDRDTFIKKVQEAYKMCVDEDKASQSGGRCVNIAQIPKGIEAIGIKPSEEVVQEAYLICMEKGNLGWDTDTFKALMDATGIKPRPSEEFILKKSNECVGDRQSIKFLKEIAGIEPRFSEELVQKMYSSYLRLGEKGQLLVEQIKAVIETTGIKPSGEMVGMVVYYSLGYGNVWVNESSPRGNTNDRGLFNALDFTNIAGIKLKLPDWIVQKAYAVCFERKGFGFYYAKELLDATETYPPEEMVKEGYDYVCADPFGVYNLKPLLEVTKVKPSLSEEAVQKTYSACIDFKEFETLKAFQEVTGIKPSEAMIQDKYLQYVQEGKIDRLEALRRVTGIKPWEVVYCRLKLKGMSIIEDFE